MGPLGSGKSVACTIELFRQAMMVPPDKRGVRKSRFAVIRNTYPELRDTTMRTVFQWFPEDLCYINRQEMRAVLQFEHTDGTTIHTELLFRPLDKPDDIKKLLSLELTGAWLNEAREIPLQVIEMIMGRVGRYPRRQEVGDYFSFVIMDTNPPDSDSWWYKLFEERKPKEWRLFKQPSAVKGTGENLANLPLSYYTNMMSGKDVEWVKVYVHGEYGFIAEGKPVWPEYNDDLHHTDNEIIVSRNIVVGIDFGLTPAAVFVQQSVTGQLQVIDELVATDMGALNFGTQLKSLCATKYSTCVIEFVGDPAGDQRSQVDEVTPFQILWKMGINAVPAETNDFTVRREVVAVALQRLDCVGASGFLVGPGAPTVRKALGGGYCYRRLRMAGAETFTDMPDKRSKFSHPGDALQYATLGLLGTDAVLGGFTSSALDYSNLDRQIV
jgi:hypothetical protein